MSDQQTRSDKANPDATRGASCDPAADKPQGPPREGGGTTGAGNLSPNQADRTGGASAGVDDPTATVTPRRGVTPDV